MRKGKIVNHKHSDDSLIRNSEFSIEFDHSTFGPYNYLYDRKRLYFDEKLGERGSYFFPLKDKQFENTEIFIERNDIVLALGERGSFSGKSKMFVEIVNLTTAAKYRFYPEEVSLVYNDIDTLHIYYKKSGKYKKLELDINTLQKFSEKSVHLSAFFKLLYNHTSGKYSRLVYRPNNRSHMAGYFIEEHITSDYSKPIHFHRNNFSLTCDGYGEKQLDVWEASLTGKL